MSGMDIMGDPLEELLDRHLADGRTVGLAVAAFDADGVVLTAYRGWVDRSARRPVTAGTVFQIGSITKVATAVLAVQQCEAGRLDPHVPVRRYLPWLPAEPYERITCHQPLSHTSGLASGSDASPSSPYQAISAAFPPAATDGEFYYGLLRQRQLRSGLINTRGTRSADRDRRFGATHRARRGSGTGRRSRSLKVWAHHAVRTRGCMVASHFW